MCWASDGIYFSDYLVEVIGCCAYHSAWTSLVAKMLQNCYNNTNYVRN